MQMTVSLHYITITIQYHYNTIPISLYHISTPISWYMQTCLLTFTFPVPFLLRIAHWWCLGPWCVVVCVAPEERRVISGISSDQLERWRAHMFLHLSGGLQEQLNQHVSQSVNQWASKSHFLRFKIQRIAARILLFQLIKYSKTQYMSTCIFRS